MSSSVWNPAFLFLLQPEHVLGSPGKTAEMTDFAFRKLKIHRNAKNRISVALSPKSLFSPLFNSIAVLRRINQASTFYPTKSNPPAMSLMAHFFLESNAVLAFSAVQMPESVCAQQLAESSSKSIYYHIGYHLFNITNHLASSPASEILPSHNDVIYPCPLSSC